VRSVASAASERPGATNEVTRAVWDEEVAWQDRAACRHGDPNLFFSPPAGESKEERRARETKAKTVCNDCPVRAACLAYAVMTREPYGVWGGLGESERRRILERRAG